MEQNGKRISTGWPLEEPVDEPYLQVIGAGEWTVTVVQLP